MTLISALFEIAKLCFCILLVLAAAIFLPRFLR